MKILIGGLNNSIHIINIVCPREEVEDGRAPNTVDLGQILVIADAPNNLGLAQNVTVVRMVFQTVDIRRDFHTLPP